MGLLGSSSEETLHLVLQTFTVVLKQVGWGW